jgi:hypothetical protein
MLHGFYGGPDVYEGRHERYGEWARHDLATYKKIEEKAQLLQVLATLTNEHLLPASESGSLRPMALRQARCQDDSGDDPTTLYGALDALYTG